MKNNFRIFYKFGVLLIIFSTITTFLNGLSIKEGLMFAAFQLGIIIIPGIAMTFIIKLEIQTDIQFLAMSYVLGYVSNIILYFIIVPLQLQVFSLLFAIILLVASLLIIFRAGIVRMELEHDKKGFWICTSLILIMLVIQQFTFCGANLIVPHANENVYYNDVLYQIGNTIALKKQYPPMDFRNYGTIYNYHYFASIQLAIMSLITEIRPIILTFCYSFFQPIVMLVLGSYCLFKKCTAKNRLVVFGMLGLLFTSGIERISTITYTAHMYLGQFGFDIGVSIFLFLLYFILLQYQKKEINMKLLVCINILFAVLVGSKAPIGVIALGMIGILCTSWLLHKKYKMAFMYGIPILIIFIVLYLFVCNAKGYSGGMSVVLNGQSMTERNLVLQKIYDSIYELRNIHVPVFLCELIFGFIHTILSNIFVFVLFWTCCIMRIFIVKKWTVIDVSCILATCLGAALTVCLHMTGLSQIYFVMATYPLALVFIVRTFDEIYTNKASVFVKKALMIYSAVLLVSGMVFWYRGYNPIYDPMGHASGNNMGIGAYLLEGYGNYKDAKTKSINVEERNSYKHKSITFVDSNMEQAYDYVRKNIPQDSLIASNRDSLSIGVFTERYIISNNKTRKIFEGEGKALDYDQLRSDGIHYLMQDKNPEFSVGYHYKLPEEQGVIVFENAAVTIYELY